MIACNIFYSLLTLVPNKGGIVSVFLFFIILFSLLFFFLFFCKLMNRWVVCNHKFTTTLCHTFVFKLQCLFFLRLLCFSLDSLGGSGEGWWWWTCWGLWHTLQLFRSLDGSGVLSGEHL